MKRLFSFVIILFLLTLPVLGVNTFGTEPSANPYPPSSAVVIDVCYYTSILVAGDDQAFYVVPSRYNGYYFASPGIHVFTADNAAIVTVQFRNDTDAVDLLGTRATIDVNEIDSVTAAVPPVVTTAGSVNQLATGDIISVDVDVVGVVNAGLQCRFLIQVQQIACDLRDKALAFFFPRLRLN